MGLRLCELSPGWKDFVAGGVGGMAAVLAGQPLDTLRIRLQQRSMRVNAGLVGTYQTLLQREGFPALFKGMAYPLMTVALANAVVFQSCGWALRVQAGGGGLVSETAPPAPPYRNVLLAGAFAGVMQTFLSTPTELVKIRLQLQGGRLGRPGYLGPWQLTRRILRVEGLRGLYRGYSLTLLRDAPSFMVYFGIYDLLRDSLEPGSRASGCSQSTVLLFSGGAAGVLAWFCVYPVDVVKSRIQAVREGKSQYTGAWDCAQKSYRAEGLQTFFKGLAATLSRAFIMNSTIFYCYATTIRALQCDSTAN